jgi:alkylation response protein AidB-like acyl-CoA dehydrogenase
MEWKLSAEQDAYQEAFRGWLSDAAPPHAVRRWLDDGDGLAFESRFAGDGWAGVGLAEDRGGQGGGMIELALTAEELGRAAAPSASWLATVLAMPALAGQDGGTQAGGTAALAVPADGVPDQAAPLSTDAAGRLTGSVACVLAGDSATRFVVPVGEGSARELRLADASATGFSRVRRHLLDRSRSAADISFDRVPSTPLAADATRTLARASASAAVLVAADSLGAAGRMLDLSVAYSKQRRQFGVPIGSFQAVKHSAASIKVGTEAGRSAVYYAAASVEVEDPASPLHAAAVKAQVTADGARAADSALTIHGAIGYTWEYDLHLFFKRARLDRQLFGPPAVWNERIAAGLALI